MSAKAWLVAMIAGSVLVLLVGARRAPEPPPAAPSVRPETPWLTREAAAEIIGPDGGLGPLFVGVHLGGLAPSAATRARIAEFARAHDVEIGLEIVDDEVIAVRFEVMYGGCCGYEGADALARRLNRPKSGSSCTGDEAWIDDWAMSPEVGVHVHASVRVNRVRVRWERTASLAEMIERADLLLGADRVAVAKRARDRWIEIEPNRRYLLEVPYLFNRYQMTYPRDLGLQVATSAGKIVEVSFSMRTDEDEGAGGTMEAMESRWGRARIEDELWSWRKRDRIVSAQRDMSTVTVTLRSR